MASFYKFHKGRSNQTVVGSSTAMPNNHFFECAVDEWAIIVVRTSTDVTKKLGVFKFNNPGYDLGETASSVPGTSMIVPPGYRIYLDPGATAQVAIDRFSVFGGIG